MSEIKQQQPKANASKASVRSNASARRQPASNPLDALTRCGFGSKTTGKRSGLQPIDGDYVPYYDRIYKPDPSTAVDTTRPAGICSFPHLKMQQQLEPQQAPMVNQQSQQHSVAEPKIPEPCQEQQQQQPPQSSGGDCPQAEHHCAANDHQVTGQQQQHQQQQPPQHQQPPIQQSVPDPHEYVTKCPNCAATLVLTPQMIPCQPGQ